MPVVKISTKNISLPPVIKVNGKVIKTNTK